MTVLEACDIKESGKEKDLYVTVAVDTKAFRTATAKAAPQPTWNDQFELYALTFCMIE